MNYRVLLKGKPTGKIVVNADEAAAARHVLDRWKVKYDGLEEVPEYNVPKMFQSCLLNEEDL